MRMVREEQLVAAEARLPCDPKDQAVMREEVAAVGEGLPFRASEVEEEVEYH